MSARSSPKGLSVKGLTPEQEIAAYVKERDVALSTLDMAWARKMMPNASCDEVRLIAMHKARLHATKVKESLRRQSARWLFDRCYKDLLGNPIDPLGPLP